MQVSTHRDIFAAIYRSITSGSDSPRLCPAERGREAQKVLEHQGFTSHVQDRPLEPQEVIDAMESSMRVTISRQDELPFPFCYSGIWMLEWLGEIHYLSVLNEQVLDPADGMLLDPYSAMKRFRTAKYLVCVRPY